MVLSPTAPASLLRAAPDVPRVIAGVGRAKVIGNGLRELDRFLNLLTDEVAGAVALPSGFDRPAFMRRRNTPAKLRMLRGALALPDPDHARLRAVGRIRDCLFHCGGVVRRAGIVAGGVELPLGACLAMEPAELAGICRLYGHIGVELASLAEPCQPSSFAF